MKIKFLKNQRISILLAAVMVLAGMPETYVRAEGIEQAVSMAEPIENVAEKQVPVYRLEKKGEASDYGYQAMAWVDEDGNEVEGESLYSEEGGAARVKARSVLPDAYDMREQGELPGVRNQGQWGTCWAHAAIASVETNMVKNGLANVGSVDYSERHLSYFSHKRNAALGDGTDNKDNQYLWYGGGNYQMAVAQLAGWYGAAAESDYPYYAYTTEGEMRDLAEGERSKAVSHLTNASVLSMPEESGQTEAQKERMRLETMDRVKRAVMDNGAVMCSYYTGDGTLASALEEVYNADKHDIDHSVSIVGWDDNHDTTSAESNFSDKGRKPKANGAWLCRNSWGSAWGDGGYFWISYEDATLGEFCSFEADAVSNYEEVHQYDGAGYNSTIGYEKAANIFHTEYVEELKAVSFYAFKDYDYLIEIYTGDIPAKDNPDVKLEKPSDGTLAYSQQGSLDTPGYHTIPLDTGVILWSGIDYAVSVQLIPKDGGSAVTYFEAGDAYTAEPGQSFFYSNGEWTDTTTMTDGQGQNLGFKNVCIKVFSDYIREWDKPMLKAEIDEAAKVTDSEKYTKASWDAFTEKRGFAEWIFAHLDTLEEETGETWTEAEKKNLILRQVMDLRAARMALAPAEIYIKNPAEFENFAHMVSSGADYEGQTVRLMQDLDMSGISHHPVGSGQVAFEGTFDGGGHSIVNLENEYEYGYSGLFALIGEKGTVKNLKLTEVEFVFKEWLAGGIAAENRGTISGCQIEGNILFDCAGFQLGGLAGSNKGTIEESSLNGKVTFSAATGASSGYYVGGLVGNNWGNISKCFIEGQIVSDSNASTGGIVGWSEPDSVVEQCYNMAVISGAPSGNTCTGGIGVMMAGTASDCFNYGAIQRPAGANGAVYVWLNENGKPMGTVSNCYYLDSSSAKGGYADQSQIGKMTADEFSSGKTAYYLNTNGGNGAGARVWSQGEGAPIFADEENKAVIKVDISQGNRDYTVSFHGVSSGELYVKGGSEITAAVTKSQGREPEAGEELVVVSATNLVRSEADYFTFIMPEEDVRTVVSGGVETKKYTVTLPTDSKYEMKSCAGYVSGRVDGEYRFTIETVPGYEVTSVKRSDTGAAVIPQNGIYQVDGIISDVTLSVEGIRLANGCYTVEKYNGFVGAEAVITPKAPASGIKATGANEFSDSLTVPTDRSVTVVACDGEGIQSDEETITFDKVDTTAPVIASVENVTEGDYYDEAVIRVEASDAESGIAGYSFDGGKTWQEENEYLTDCGESEQALAGRVMVRDNVGNVAEYTGSATIPASVKRDSALTLSADQESCPYGAEVMLTAELIAEDLENVSNYGKVTFLALDGTLLGTADMVSGEGGKVRAQFKLLDSLYGNVGTKSYKASYNGKGTPFKNCESGECQLSIRKAAAAEIKTEVPERKTVSASEQYTEDELKALIGIEQIEVMTDSGIKRYFPVEWSTSDAYRIKGGTYHYTGKIFGNENIDVPEDMILQTAISVEPVVLSGVLSLPSIEVEQAGNALAGISDLGQGMFPNTGTVRVGSADVSYSVVWDQTERLDLTAVGNSTEFTGVVIYEDVPEWVTVPESARISRKVTVKAKAAPVPGPVTVLPVKQKPAAVTGVTAEPNTASIKVKWNKIEGADRYVVSVYQGNKFLKSYTTAECSMTVKKLKKVTKYSVKVAAVNQAGQGQDSALVKTGTCPGKPKLSTVKKAGKGKAKVAFKKVSKAQGYAVFSKMGKGKYKRVGTTKKTSFTVKKLKKGKKYSFQVKAYIKNGSTYVYGKASNTKTYKVK